MWRTKFFIYRGSLSPNAGEFFVQGCNVALQKQKPMVMFWASGGIQVQTSLFGLNNMPKCISAINDLNKAGIPLFQFLQIQSQEELLASLFWEILILQSLNV